MMEVKKEEEETGIEAVTETETEAVIEEIEIEIEVEGDRTINNFKKRIDKKRLHVSIGYRY